jgi:predicted nucleotide-binding protein (sugar kinase/HSP70/actin superfamily)
LWDYTRTPLDLVASCFKQLGIEAIVSIVEDLILFYSDLYGKLDKLKQPSARTKRKALVENNNILMSPLPEDADDLFDRG